MNNPLKLILFTGLLVSSGIASAKDLYVSTGGSDGNACTATGTPCLTIAGVVGKSASGDKIHIRTGTYNSSSDCQIYVSHPLEFYGGYTDDGFSSRASDPSSTLLTDTRTGSGTVCRLFAINTPVNSGWVIFDGLKLGGIVAPASHSGALLLYGDGGWLRLNNAILSDSDMESGRGAILADTSDDKVEIFNSTLSNNRASDYGGAIAMTGSNSTLTITDSTISGNTAGTEGGAIYLAGTSTATISNSIINNNISSTGRGGAIILVEGASLTLSGSKFKSNRAISTTSYTGSGGAISVFGGASSGSKTVLAISDTEFEDNFAQELGGAVYIQGNYDGHTGSYVDVNIERSSFIRNNANFGAGVFTWKLAGAANHNISISNSTFFENDAQNYGGAVTATYNESKITIDHSTFLGNRAKISGTGSSAAIDAHSDSASITVSNSIIVANTSNGVAADTYGTVTDSNNIMGSNNVVASAVADNGGLTKTLKLLTSSTAAIGKVASCGLSVDQRGYSRPSSNCDIGAYEEVDTDGDGVPDKDDNCVTDPTTVANNINTDGDQWCDTNDNDDDNDGLNDGVDANSLTPIGACLDTDGDGAPNVDCGGHPVIDNDDDGDGDLDGADNCPLIPNADQANADGDTFGDVCDNDADNDGLDDLDGSDPYPGVNLADIGLGDWDGDGRPDSCPGSVCTDNGIAIDPDHDNDGVSNGADNCPMGNGSNNDDDANDDQLNTDGDAWGNFCDPDNDNDGDLDGADNCPLIANADQANLDNDSFGDVCDADIDGDGFDNEYDNCESIANNDQLDSDGDGRGDVCAAVFVKTASEGGVTSGNCGTWNTACSSVSYAVGRASSLTMSNVYIAKGVYHISSAITVPAGMSLVGGFAGTTESSVSEANPATNLTILSGNPVATSLIEKIDDKIGNSSTAGLLYINNNGLDVSDKVTLSGLILNASGQGSSGTQALRVVASRAALNNMRFVANDSEYGAVLVDAGSIVTISDSVFSQNRSKAGAALFLKGNNSQLTINSSHFSSNEATGNGGVIYQYINTRLLISASTFDANQSQANGGAIQSNAGFTELSIEGSTFRNNSSAGNGGAIIAYTDASIKSRLTLSNSHFEANSANTSGGALAINGSWANSEIDALVENSSFINNQATTGAAIMYYTQTGGSNLLTINNSTFADNTSTSSGGALGLTDGGNTLISYSSFYNNSATDGGAIKLKTGTLTLSRSLLIGNTADNMSIDNVNNFTDGGFNLIGANNVSGVMPAAAFVLPENSPAANGSFIATVGIADIINTSVSHNSADDIPTKALTKQVSLVEDSVARDVMTLAECGGIDQDQRGQPRPDNRTGMCDVGAFEYTDLSCKDAAAEVADSGNYYLVNCDPDGEWLLNFGDLGGGSIRYPVLFILLSLLLARPRAIRLK